jgi:hypothetical protein
MHRPGIPSNRSSLDLDAELPLNVSLATWRVFVQPERFADMHVAYTVSAAERTTELMAAPAQDRIPHSSTEAGKRRGALISAARLRGATARTFGLAAIACLTAVAAAAALGQVHPSLPWHGGKVLQTVGGLLALWGTLLAVDGPPRSWSGTSAAERVHVAVFTWLLTLGACAALLGTLISP